MNDTAYLALWGSYGVGVFHELYKEKLLRYIKNALSCK